MKKFGEHTIVDDPKHGWRIVPLSEAAGRTMADKGMDYNDDIWGKRILIETLARIDYVYNGAKPYRKIMEARFEDMWWYVVYSERTWYEFCHVAKLTTKEKVRLRHSLTRQAEDMFNRTGCGIGEYVLQDY